MEQLSHLYDAQIKRTSLVERKQVIEASHTLVVAPQGAGSTTLLLSALSHHKPSISLYIDLEDIRIDRNSLLEHLPQFCKEKSIEVLAIDGYDGSFELPELEYIYLTSTQNLHLENFTVISLLPLDFEEFLALDSRYDNLETALSHFLQIGGFPQMIHVSTPNRVRHLQSLLKLYLNELELEILTFVAKNLGNTASVFQIFERIRNDRKLSKDLFYKTFYTLIEKRWLLWLEKYQHPKAIKKLYLIDFAIKNVLTFTKNFSKLFESVVFLELVKTQKELYYDDGIDFFIPNESRVVMTLAFATEKHLFTLMERIEAFVIAHNVKKVEVVTMNSEAKLHHPFVEVEMIAFTRWALIES